MSFKPNEYFNNQYDPLDLNSIYEYSKKMVGKTLRDLCHPDITKEDPNYLEEKDIKKRSGKNFGHYLEKYYFGYSNNNESEADFLEAGLELKSSGLKVRDTKYYSMYVKKEPRLTLSTINNAEIINEEFDTSSFYKKNKTLLIVFFDRDVNDKFEHNIDKKVIDTYLYTLANYDYEIIKNDWELIRNKVRNCEAHNLRNRDTEHLESCRGESKAREYKDYFNQDEYCPEPAKNKRFAYKKDFLSNIIDMAVN